MYHQDKVSAVIGKSGGKDYRDFVLSLGIGDKTVKN
jgi:hypothetical protein